MKATLLCTATLTAVCLNSGFVNPSWGQTPGALTQLPGITGCISETGSGGGCADGKGLDGASSVAVSPDGKHVYAASPTSDAVTAFARDLETGVLTQLPGLDGCISETGDGPCTDGRALEGAHFVTVSPDGRHVYVGAQVSSAIVVFTRNKTTGALSQSAGEDGCISHSGSGGLCTDGKALLGVYNVTVSKDGKHVYAASYGSSAVAVFARNKITGALTQLAGLDGCVSAYGAPCTTGAQLFDPTSLALSKDGKHVYATSSFSDAVLVFARNKTTGALTQIDGCVSETTNFCTNGKALDFPRSVTVSKDGKHVYVASAASDAVAALARNKTTGALIQLGALEGCISQDGSGPCTDGKALIAAFSVSVSPDGKHVYVASSSSNAVAVFTRNKTTGVLTQLNDDNGCIADDPSFGACRVGKALLEPRSVAVSPDGKHVYVASSNSNAVAVFAREQ